MILGQGAVLGIGLNIYAVNNFSGPAAQAQASMRALQNEFTQTWTENLRTLRTFYTGAAAAGMVALRGMTSFIKEAGKFDMIMAGVGVASEASAIQQENLANKAKTLGVNFGYGAKEVANAMKVMALAGYSADDVASNIDAMIAGAKAAQEPLKESTDVFTNVMSMYDISSNNVMRVVDLMSKAAIGSKADLLTLGESIAYAGATLTSLKVPLEESLAMLMVMHDVGIRGSMAGTSVKNMFDYIAKAVGQFKTGRQDKALVGLGLTPADFKDAQGNLKTTGELVKVLAQAALKQSTIGQKTLFQALFGMRGERAAIKLIQDTDKINKNIKDLYNLPAGFALSNAQKQMENMGGDIEQMIAGWEAFKISLGNSLAPIVIPALYLLRKVTEGLSWFFGTWVGKGIAMILGLGLALKTIIWAFKALQFTVLIAFSTQRVTFENMKIAQLMGWAQLRAAVLGYRNAILSTNVAMGTSSVVGGVTTAGVPYAMNKAGRAFYPAGSKAAYGVSGMVPKAAMASKGGGIMGALGLAGLFGRGAAATGASAATAGVGIGSKLLGFISGPWGWALTAIAILGPMIYQALKGNSDDTEDNTAALRDGTATQRSFNIVALQNMKGEKHYFGPMFGTPSETKTAFAKKEGSVTINDIMDKVTNQGATIILNIDGVKSQSYKLKDFLDKDTMINGYIP